MESYIYASENGNTKVQVIVEDKTVWSTQSTISNVFNTSRTSIVERIKNITHQMNWIKIQHVGKSDMLQMRVNREYKYTKQIIKTIYFFKISSNIFT